MLAQEAERGAVERARLDPETPSEQRRVRSSSAALRLKVVTSVRSGSMVPALTRVPPAGSGHGSCRRPAPATTHSSGIVGLNGPPLRRGQPAGAGMSSTAASPSASGVGLESFERPTTLRTVPGVRHPRLTAGCEASAAECAGPGPDRPALRPRRGRRSLRTPRAWGTWRSA